ncbi:23S rRNA (uracil1939-C5)-methyltransferase [Mycoplasmopsis mustelae]|uniref:23S rRNA (Uracil1939-C5)-methyltransferase n=1 Tax=Mycoplasmopsis mustelae TaxID=171289 RepID=A0A4R7UDC8_9BACT|nr:23S rRNA (uracil(1939)-C(5))-methyltransferase RlmD [Mycoplasmopsis mustelae]TDV23064.1 23S rRNA (uracil1939-C5)-methyltransferase [Mycoplasmopsis mustelae]
MNNKKIRVECSELSYEGFGVSRQHQKPIFVKNFFVGEVADVVIYKETTKYAFANVIRLIKRSPYRNSQQYKCTNSAPLINLEYSQQIKFKQNYLQNLITRNLNVAPELIHNFVAAENPLHYRNKIRVPLKIYAKKLVFGEYDNNSNNIILNTDLQIQNEPILNETLKTILKIINDYSIEKGKQKLLQSFSEITLRCNKSNEVSCLIKLHSGSNSRNFLHHELYNVYLEKIPSLIELYVSKNDIISNVFSKKNFKMQILSKKFSTSITSFFQINIEITTKIFQLIKQKVKKQNNKLFLDLFCGVGVISQLVARRNQSILGIDINRDAINSAKLNAKYNKFTNYKYITGDVFNVLDIYPVDTKDTFVIVDPPRFGLKEDIIKWLDNFSFFIYISCDARTLVRDIRLLAQQGFDVDFIQGFDMFPNTAHFETVAFLSKK